MIQFEKKVLCYLQWKSSTYSSYINRTFLKNVLYKEVKAPDKKNLNKTMEHAQRE